MKTTVNCIVVDDEPLARKVIESHIESMPGLTLISSFQRPLEALSFLQQETVDLVFLDIQIPMLTGREFVRSLPSETAVIFTTAYREFAYREFAIEGFELDAVDYLLKPVTLPRFLEAANKFQAVKITGKPSLPKAGNNSVSGGYLYVNANKKHVKVAFQDILYVESQKDYVCIHTAEQEVTTKAKISDYAALLGSSFLRTHRSFLVNLSKITAFTALDVEIGDREIPIGGSCKQLVWERLKS